MGNKNISKLKFFVSKVLPLVYDDSLSYYEILGKVVNKLNEVVKSNNDMNTELQDFLSTFSGNLYTTLSKIIDELINEGAFQNIVRAYSQTSVNDEFYRCWIADMAQEYISHFNDFIYGADHSAFRPSVIQVGNKWEINCSTFSVLLMCGIGFKDSKYGGGNNTRNELGYNDTDFISWFSSPKTGTTGSADEDWNYSYDIAERFYNQGITFYPEPDLSNVQTGDILFLALTPDEGVENPFMGITHSAVFGYKANDGIYTCWEVGNAGPIESKYPITYANENLVLCARLPYNQSQNYKGENLITNALTEYNVTSNVIRTCTPINGIFKANKQYTLVAHIEYEYALTTVYPAIVDSETTLLTSDYGALHRPKDNIFVIPFTPKVDTDFVYLQTRTATVGLNVNAKCEWCGVYEGLILYRKDKPTKQFVRNVTAQNIGSYRNTISTYYYENHLDFFAVISGTFTSGVQNTASLSGIRRVLNIIPLTAIALNASGGHECCAFIDMRGTTPQLRVIVPEGLTPTEVFVHTSLPSTYYE